MKTRIFILAAFLVSILNATQLLADLPSLEFDPSMRQHYKKTQTALNLKQINDDILDFLAKNLLLDKADVVISEIESETNNDFENDAKNAQHKLQAFKIDLQSQSILSQEKLNNTFNQIQRLIKKHPSKVQEGPQGNEILIQTHEDKIIKIQLIELT